MGQVRMSIQSLRRSPLNKKCSLLLKDEATERYISIYIGESEANSIRNALIKPGYPEEDYPSLEKMIFKAFRLKSIVIDRFVDNVFYTKLIVERDNESLKIECPTSQAIVSALREGAPILIDEVVLNRAELNSVFCKDIKSKEN